MHMTKQQQFLEAQIYIINCKFYLKQSLDAKPHQKTHRSHDYFQYDQPAYYCIAAFNGMIEPQQDSYLH